MLMFGIKKDFVPGTLKKFKVSDSTGVATIGGLYLSPHFIGNIRTSWYDDDEKLYDCILRGVLYFPDSPVNIISVTALEA